MHRVKEGVSLTPEEFREEKEFLRAAMARTEVSETSTIWERMTMLVRAPVLASISALFIACGGGVAWASQTSVPGELLYPVKTDIIEPFIGRLKHTPQAKAEWSMHLLQQRLREVEVVLVRGGGLEDLDPQLQTLVNAATKKASADAAVLPAATDTDTLHETVTGVLNAQEKRLLNMPRTTHTIRMLRTIQSLRPEPSKEPPHGGARPYQLDQLPAVPVGRPSSVSSSARSYPRPKSSVSSRVSRARSSSQSSEGSSETLHEPPLSAASIASTGGLSDLPIQMPELP